ncbi:DUF5131 family protein [Desulfatibacillum aliphaticivorans]|uniref:DUF5131 family protein n=1 Tax=Desulfatibacillum aliphaticivorans TaxID=218208 RepID=UPI0006858AD7|nr:DUF5131 family protein [Desulfatibacillum aliphaticivorans]
MWAGVTVCNQAEANEKLFLLLQVLAAVHFVSIEPMLGAVWLTNLNTAPELALNSLTGIECICETPASGPKLDLVVLGVENGRGAGVRPMHPAWPRKVRDDCQAAGVAFFFMGHGEFVSVSEVEGPGKHHYFEDGATVRRVGKKAAGRLLDGRTWDEFPMIE